MVFFGGFKRLQFIQAVTNMGPVTVLKSFLLPFGFSNISSIWRCVRSYHSWSSVRRYTHPASAALILRPWRHNTTATSVQNPVYSNDQAYKTGPGLYAVMIGKIKMGYWSNSESWPHPVAPCPRLPHAWRHNHPCNWWGRNGAILAAHRQGVVKACGPNWPSDLLVGSHCNRVLIIPSEFKNMPYWMPVRVYRIGII